MAKKIWSKRFGSKIFLSKKRGRVNPRWRIYHPPPENSRVKIVLGGWVGGWCGETHIKATGVGVEARAELGKI